MEYINIHRSVLDGAEFVGAEPLDRATWLMLLSYCCGQENGGVIEACRTWADRRWQQLAKVTAEEVQRVSDLWKWDGDDLVVNFYPEDSESQVKAMRRGGKIGNRRMQENRKANKRSIKPPSQPPSVIPSTAPLQAGRPDNEMERNEMEEKGMENPLSPNPESWRDFPEIAVPSKEDAVAWAVSTGRVDPDWAALKWENTTGNHGWERNGRLIGWQRLWLVWFDADVQAGKFRKNGAKNSGEVSANVQAIQDGKRVAELQAEIKAGKAEVENMKALGQDYRAEKKAVEQLMAELDAVKGGNE